MGGTKFVTKFIIFFLKPVVADATLSTAASPSPNTIPASSLNAASSLVVEYVFDISWIIFDW